MPRLLILFASLVLGWLTPAFASGPGLTLTWTNRGTTARGIIVERSIGRSGSFHPLAGLPPDRDRYVDTQVQSGTEYCYRVHAYNAAGASESSNVACGLPRGDAELTTERRLDDPMRSEPPTQEHRRATEPQPRRQPPVATSPGPAPMAGGGSATPEAAGQGATDSGSGAGPPSDLGASGGATAGSEEPASPKITLEPLVADGLDRPVYLTHSGDDSGRVFIVEQAGRVWPVENGRRLGRPFLDISSRVSASGERGLLGLAFHPQHRANRRYFVLYTRVGDGALVLAEYRASDDPTLSETDERRLLVVPQPFTDHMGGMIEFGPDGLLYVGVGDGGGAGDPGNRAQNPRELLGKILRIDINRRTPYGIPPGNPWIGQGRPEIYALGFRNPFRFSFDPATGRLFAGDIGQAEVEEIDLVRRGGNYGWRLMEGSRCFDPPTNCRIGPLELPIAEYTREGRRCGVVGGYVYRGRRIPDLVGTYLFGDRCSGEILALIGRQITTVKRTELSISSFGQDQERELYVVDLGGSVHRIIADQ